MAPGVVAWDDPKDGKPYYLHIHQAISIPDVETNLLCPGQLRAVGVRVNDEPKHSVPEPTKYHHAIAAWTHHEE